VAFPVWLNNLIAYSLQIAILAAAGTLLAYIFRLRVPRVTLIYWQLLLLACLFVPLMQSWNHPVVNRAIPSSGTVATVSVETSGITGIAVPENQKPEKRIPWELLPSILLAGIVLRLLWLSIGFLRLGLFRRKSHLFSEERSIIQDMQWRTGVRVTVLLCNAIHSPVTFGFRSPTIILPLSFKELSESCKQAVLCHELLHVRRYDWVLIIAEEIIRSIFWFHPAIWWLLSRVHLSREQAVDYEVVQLTGNKEPYLNSLLEFARTHSRLNAVPAPLFLSEHHLVQRVALLIKEVSMSRSRLTISMIGISALLIGTFYLAVGWFPLTGASMYAQEQNPRFEFKNPLTNTSVPESAKNQIASLAVEALPVVAPAPAAAPAPAQVQNAGAENSAPQKAPIRVGDNIQESKLIRKVAPVYPELAIRARVKGAVKLAITVDEAGYVKEVQVMGGHPLLIDAAVAAVKQWQYSPTLLNGAPVPVLAQVTIIFNMMGKDDLQVSMDESGILNRGIEELQQVQGTVHLNITRLTPYRVADSVIRDLIQKGIQRIEVSGSYLLFQNRLFYVGMPDRPQRPPLMDENISRALAAAVEANQGQHIGIGYRLFLNEAGEAVGLECLGIPFPDLERDLMLYRGDPAFLNGEPVPYAYEVWASASK
jgi:TonB family protein